MLRPSLNALLFVGCLGCEGRATTSGHPVSLQTRLRADPEVAQPFATETGWTVELSKAAVSVGALYYFDGEPAFVSRESKGAFWRHLASLFTLPVVRAHPGHYTSGMALGQMLSPWSADLLAPNNELPDAMGLSGRYRSARFVLAAPTAGPALSELAGHVAVAEGSASKGDRTIYFRLSADLADLERSAVGGQVEGCVFDEAEVQEDGVVQVTIEPHVWFNLVNFDGVAPGTPEQPTVITAGETSYIAFSLGLVQLSAYHFAYQPTP